MDTSNDPFTTASVKLEKARREYSNLTAIASSYPTDENIHKSISASKAVTLATKDFLDIRQLVLGLRARSNDMEQA